MDKISKTAKGNILLTNALNLDRLNMEKIDEKLKVLLGKNILDIKAGFKHTLINPKTKRARMIINHLKSEHTMSIQKSKYLAIEHDL